MKITSIVFFCWFILVFLLRHVFDWHCFGLGFMPCCFSQFQFRCFMFDLFWYFWLSLLSLFLIPSSPLPFSFYIYMSVYMTLGFKKKGYCFLCFGVSCSVILVNFRLDFGCWVHSAIFHALFVLLCVGVFLYCVIWMKKRK